MAKLVAKTLPDVQLSTLKPIFDEIAEDCSLLNVSADVENNTLTLTIDTDLVITYKGLSNSPTYFSSITNYFNGNDINSRTANISVGANVPFRVVYSESFIYCHLRGGSNIPWFIFEKIENNKFAYANVTSGMDSYCPMKTMDNKYIERYPRLVYSMELGTLDFVSNSVLCTATSPTTKVLEDPHLYPCSYTGLNSTTPDKILTINNHDYFALTPYLLIPLDDE